MICSLDALLKVTSVFLFVNSKHCDRCRAYHYGFSVEGCLDCDCDEWGSTNYQCDVSGQCSCQENVEGRRCDRCVFASFYLCENYTYYNKYDIMASL